MPVVDFVMQEGVPLAPLTTMGVGGPARYFVRAESAESVAGAATWAQEQGLPLLILGRGSNVLVSDDGFPGMVLRVAIPGLTIHRSDGAVEVTAGAGESWSALVARAVSQHWAGVECLSGIPGLVGATPVQNVGAYGQEVCETITRVEAFDLQTRNIVTFTNETCGFSYRSSYFKREGRGRYVILAVTYRLFPGASPNVHYVELERTLAVREITRPTLRDVRRAVLSIRRKKSMLLTPDDPNARSAGSFFINPLLTDAQIALLDDIIAADFPGQRIPRFAAPEGGVKVPAAWLIERAGFERGHQTGVVGLSSNHSLAIVNRGGATAHDVLTLARQIRDHVRARFGVTLVPEPALIGVSLDDT